MVQLHHEIIRLCNFICVIHSPGITLLFHLFFFLFSSKSSLSFKTLFRFHILPNPIPVLPNGLRFSLIWTTLYFRWVFMEALNTVYPVLCLHIHVLSSSVRFESLKSRDKFLVLFKISRLFHTRDVCHICICIAYNILS